MENLPYENEFDSHAYESVGRTSYHMKGFTQRLVVTQRGKATQKMAYSAVFCGAKTIRSASLTNIDFPEITKRHVRYPVIAH